MRRRSNTTEKPRKPTAEPWAWLDASAFLGRVDFGAESVLDLSRMISGGFMTKRRSRQTALLTGAAVSIAFSGTLQAAPAWSGYANDPYHSAAAPAASDPLSSIRWQTPVDLAPQFSGNDLLIHYGSPTITAANTVLVPVKTGATNGFEINAINGGTGVSKWTV